MFLVTSIAMLRERTSGTLERLMSMPLAKGDLLVGYGIAFALLATVQATIASAVAFGLLGLDVAGLDLGRRRVRRGERPARDGARPPSSAFASTEFQAVQFMPAVILPQILLCGLLVPRDRMADVLEAVSWLLPMTYAYDGLARATTGEEGVRLVVDVCAVVGAIALALSLGAATLRRRTP